MSWVIHMRSASSSTQLIAKTSVGGTTKDELIAEKEQLEQRQAKLNGQIGRTKKRGEDPSELIEQNRQVSKRIKQIEEKLAEEETDQMAAVEDALVTEVLTTTEVFRDLRNEWSELMSQADVYSPFMMWEWLYPWWKFFGQNKRLRLITVRDGQNRLVGLAPMMLGFVEDGRCDPRVLAFVGSGEEGPRGHYFGFIAIPERQEEILHAIVEAVRELRSEWQIMNLWRVRQDDLYHAFLDILSQYDDMGVIIESNVTCVRAALPATMKDFIDSVPYRTRRQRLRYQEDKLKKKYSSVRHEVCTSIQELPRFLNTIHDLNMRRYQTKGTPSAWLPARKKACFNEAARLLFATEGLRAELLWLDGHPAAGLAGLIQNNTYVAFESGFAPRFTQDGVGHALFGLSIEDCIKSGLKYYDWLSAYDYKYQYCSNDERLVELTVFYDGSSSLGYVGSHFWSRGVKARIKKLVCWPKIKKFVGRIRSK